MLRRAILAWLGSCTVVVLSVGIASAQSVKKEFFDEAPKKWLELRTRSFEDIAIQVDSFMKHSTDRAKETFGKPREIKTRFIRYANGSFKFSESSPISDTDPRNKVPFYHRFITIHNGDETFVVNRAPNQPWKLIRKEESTEKLEFIAESIEAGWSSRNRRSIRHNLISLFADDPRLFTSRSGSVESLIAAYRKHDEKCFRDFKVRTDERFGRVVSVSLATEYDLANLRRRNPKRGAKIKVQGKLEFLADWYWLPLAFEFTHRELDKDGKELGLNKRRMTYAYDPKQFKSYSGKQSNRRYQIIPKSVELESRTSGSGFSSVIRHDIRRLNREEIASIEKHKKPGDFVKEKK